MCILPAPTYMKCNSDHHNALSSITSLASKMIKKIILKLEIYTCIIKVFIR